jgi:hypothetical protein
VITAFFAARIFFGVLAGLQARDEVPRIVRLSCVRCHNADNVLDLRVLPDAEEKGTWARILDMVESYRMPPPKSMGAPEERFPLDPRQRGILVEGIRAMLGDAIDMQFPPHLSAKVWRSIVKEVVGPLIPEKKLDAMLDAFDPPADLTPIQATDQLFLNTTSREVCTAIARADLAKPAGKRRYLRAESGSASGSPKDAELVVPLFEAVYGEPPDAERLAAGQKTLRAFRQVSKDIRTAWIGLCTSYLAGPQLLYLSYVQER